MCGYVWVCMCMYEYVWVCVGMYGYVQVCMSMCGYVWVCMGMYEYVWVCMSMYGYVLVFMGMYRIASLHIPPKFQWDFALFESRSFVGPHDLDLGILDSIGENGEGFCTSAKIWWDLHNLNLDLLWDRTF